MDTITDLKVRLYDVIEQQAVLQAEFNRLEQVKSDLAKQLGQARQEAEAAKPQNQPKRRAEMGSEQDAMND